VADIAAAVGRQPGDITSKIVVHVDGDEPAAAAYVRGLANFADAIARNRDGAIAAIDTEFLHDLRVAVRRSRSLLRHAGGVVPEELRDCFAPELAWLQGATSDARDFDVWSLELDPGDALLPFVEMERARAHE